MQDRSTVNSNQRAQRIDLSAISRADFLKLAALTAGAAATAGALAQGTPTMAEAASRSPKQDRAILEFLLVIEYLQAAFYRDALVKGALHGDLEQFAHVAALHERDHVRLLRRKLGSSARKPPHFDFGETTSHAEAFARSSLRLEDLAIGAFIGHGANLTRKAVVDVARITSVEGRHAAWIRDIRKELPAPVAADPGLPQAKVEAALRATGFVKGGAA